MRGEKVLLVTHNDFPFGGACANFLRYLSLGYAEKGIAVEILLQRGRSYQDDTIANLPGLIRFRFLAFERRPSNVFLKAADTLKGTIRPFFHVLSSARNEYSLVYIYNRSGFELLPVTFAAKLRNIPVCNIVVEWYEKENLVRKRIHMLRWYDFLLRMKYLNKYFDYLLVLTTFLKKYYTDGGYPEKNIALIPNLVDLKIELRRTDVMLERYPKRAAVRLGYCGSPTRKDGIHDLLDAVSILREKGRNVELFVIGDLPGELSVITALKDYAADKGIADIVIFSGLVPFGDVAPMLNTCDVLVLARPSGVFADAGFPTKLGEYMACRKPVVLTKVGDFPHYFADESAVLLAEPDNPASVAQKIGTLLDNPELCRQLAENGYKWGMENLDYRENTGRLIDFFHAEKSPA